jgi:hypothetical protein
MNGTIRELKRIPIGSGWELDEASWPWFMHLGAVFFGDLERRYLGNGV